MNAFRLDLVATPLKGKGLRGRRSAVNPLTIVLAFGLVFATINFIALTPGAAQETLTSTGVIPEPVGMASAVGSDNCEDERVVSELNLSLAEKIECDLDDASYGRDWLAESKEAFEYLNNIREEYGRSRLQWSERAYLLAVYRSQDMEVRGYFDHVTPEGECSTDFKTQFGFQKDENLAENIAVLAHYSNRVPTKDAQPEQTIDGWMTSRGHRYNLLYQYHDKAAIGCYKATCTFIGVNTNPIGLGSSRCLTGEQALEYWQETPLKVDEK